MKIIATSDIHQMDNKWSLLAKTCQKNKYDVAIVAGDLFPKGQGILQQNLFLKNITKKIGVIKNTGCDVVLILGNDDNKNFERIFEENKDFFYVANKKVNIGGYEFIGMPYVPDYPFQYKDWCRGEFRGCLRKSSFQYGEALSVNSNDDFEVISNYDRYLENNKSIYEELEERAKSIENIRKSIWLIHAPPSRVDLDVCANGRRVGSDAVYDFIYKYQPLLTIHGHIHESPYYNGELWFKKINKTYCVQAGQMQKQLFYTIIDLEKRKVKSMEHSVYGKISWEKRDLYGLS